LAKTNISPPFQAGFLFTFSLMLSIVLSANTAHQRGWGFWWWTRRYRPVRIPRLLPSAWFCIVVYPACITG